MEKMNATAHPYAYPYLATRMAPAFYHIIVLPQFDEQHLTTIAIRQQMMNDLPTALVTGSNEALYINAGRTNKSTEIPAGGYLIIERLEACSDPIPYFDTDPTFGERIQEFREYIENQKKDCLFGDLTKGGRPATPTELLNLNKKNADGTPIGLVFCERCNSFKGSCLDQNPKFYGKMMNVNCLCENQNRCGKCHNLLHIYKLNANYYNPRDGQIWHVPGFSGLSHQC